MSKLTNNVQEIGILFSNLGTPDAPTTPALKRYLKEFLSDRRVVDVPRVIWFFILNLAILPFRSPKSAKNYESVWTSAGSPLLTYTQSLVKKTCAHFLESSTAHQDIKPRFALGMRYGNPSLEEALETLKGCSRILLVPLYPQYSSATTASTIDKVFEIYKKRRNVPETRTLMSYHNHPAYIQALANSIREFREKNGVAQKLLFSFHGIPKRYWQEGDPYFYECHKTAKATAELLNLSNEDWMVTFQSRFGKEEWLKPYTDETLKSLPAQSIKSVQIVCPGFAVDCLETIEEIGEENREYFLHAGGESYAYIPALNDTAAHAQALSVILSEQLQGWSV